MCTIATGVILSTAGMARAANCASNRGAFAGNSYRNVTNAMTGARIDRSLGFCCTSCVAAMRFAPRVAYSQFSRSYVERFHLFYERHTKSWFGQ